MNGQAFVRICRDFSRARWEKWGAQFGSLLASLLTLALLLVLYLFVEVLANRGRVPAFVALPPAEQRLLPEEWKQWEVEQRREAAERFGLEVAVAERVAAGEWESQPLTGREWESLWRAHVYLVLRQRVSDEAAEAFAVDAAGPSPPLGMLPLVVRERSHWAGPLLGQVAAACPWTWRGTWPARGDPSLSYACWLFVIAFVLAALRGVAANGVTYLAAAATLELLTRLRRAIYLHTYRLGSLAIRTAGPSEAVQLFTRQAEAVGTAFHARLLLPWRAVPLIAGLVLLVLLIHFWLAVSFMVLAALGWLVGGQMAVYFRRDARTATRQVQTVTALLLESLSLVRLAKCYQIEQFSQQRVERQLGEWSRAAWRKLRGDALAGPLLHSVALLAGMALLFLGAWSVLVGTFSLAGLVVVSVALVLLAGPLDDLFRYRERLRRGEEAAEAVVEFLERRGEAAEAVDAEYLPPLQQRIEFRNVSVQEPGSSRLLLDGLSFAIPAGAKVAFVSADPRPARTLAYLLVRFFDPSSGEIRFDDKNIRWVTHESLRLQVALVMEDDGIFTDTVANNIGCGDPQYRLPQIIEAAKLAHAHQFIERLYYGYETVVGPYGHSLTPGQAFRIALARALLREPAVLVVEEPATAIDDDTWMLLDDTLARVAPGRTLIILAHRLTTLRRMDRVFVLREGRIVDSGTHRELWQRNEYYRRLQLLADAAIAGATAD